MDIIRACEEVEKSLHNSRSSASSTTAPPLPPPHDHAQASEDANGSSRRVRTTRLPTGAMALRGIPAVQKLTHASVVSAAADITRPLPVGISTSNRHNLAPSLKTLVSLERSAPVFHPVGANRDVPKMPRSFEHPAGPDPCSGRTNKWQSRYQQVLTLQNTLGYHPSTVSWSLLGACFSLSLHPAHIGLRQVTAKMHLSSQVHTLVGQTALSRASQATALLIISFLLLPAPLTLHHTSGRKYS